MNRPEAPAPLDDLWRELMEIQRTRCEDLLQFRSLASARQYRPLYDLLRSSLPRGAEVLDWGCGNGHFSYVAARLGYRVTGYAFEDFCLRPLIGESYRFVQGNEEAPVVLPFGDSAFDAVTSVGVLEHVRETGGDEVASLREIRRVLRSGAIFVCFHLPNRYSAIEAVSGMIPGKHHHPYRYTAGDVRRLCREAGLEPVALRRYGTLPRNLTQRLPIRLRESRLLADGWDLADRALGYPLSPISQNYYFVARRP